MLLLDSSVCGLFFFLVVIHDTSSELVRVLGVPGVGLLQDLVFSRPTTDSPVSNASPVEYGRGKQSLR